MRITLNVVAVAIAISLLSFSTANASHLDDVEIRFDSPTQLKYWSWKERRFVTAPTLQPQSGWPLNITLTIRNELGIAIDNGLPPFFPRKGQTGFVVFDDPDGCLAMDSVEWAPVNDPCVDASGNQLPSDETFLEFTPDVDDIGLPDSWGNADRIAALVDATSGRQTLNPSGMEPTNIGAFTSGVDSNGIEVVDGYGNGADDDIPGLVLLTEHGQGIVYNTDGTLPATKELVNIAGFVNSVGYTLNNPFKRSTIKISMIVPRQLVAPVVIADECVGDPASTTDPCVNWYSVDGADFVPAVDLVGFEPTTAFAEGYKPIFESTKYKVMAMVVSGTAPDTVQDLAAPYGEIDEADLEAMGYTVIGRKKTAEFDQYGSHHCYGLSGSNILYFDLDGNGIDRFGDVCPAGAGSLSRPPR